MIYTSDFSLVSRSMLYSFIKEISDDFVQPLLDRIDVDVYYSKLKDLSSTVFCLDNQKIIGIIVIYCNDVESRYGYVSLLGVAKNYRRRHIATSLIKNAVEKAKFSGMSRMGVHTMNTRAKDLYQKYGFKMIKSEVAENQLTVFY